MSSVAIGLGKCCIWGIIRYNLSKGIFNYIAWYQLGSLESSNSYSKISSSILKIGNRLLSMGKKDIPFSYTHITLVHPYFYGISA